MNKIALVADVEGWAFDIAAHIIKEKLSSKYEIDIYYGKSEEMQDDLFIMLEKLKNYDIIHFFWRKTLLQFENREFINKVKEKYGDYQKYVNEYVPKISTGVYDHLFEDDIEFNIKFTKYCKFYVVSSKKLLDRYSNLEYIKRPTCEMGDTFEKKFFFPVNIERFNKENIKNREIIIGWVGNSTWNYKEKDENGNSMDFKGLHTILKPVVKSLIEKGYNIKLKYADKNIKVIPNEEMYKFYSQIDIYVCVSAREGTPKPLLEAMGCGIPIITTEVGVASEVLIGKQREFILGERNVNRNDEIIRKKLEEKLIKLYNNRGIFKELSEENYIVSERFESEKMKEKYMKYFDNFIKENSKNEG